MDIHQLHSNSWALRGKFFPENNLHAPQHLSEHLKNYEQKQWDKLMRLYIHKDRILSSLEFIQHFNPQNPNECQYIIDWLKVLRPWRKGPYQFFFGNNSLLSNLTIDSEWNSELKWQRLAPHINQFFHTTHKTQLQIADIGGNNAFYLFRLLEDLKSTGVDLKEKIHQLVNLDPTPMFFLQAEALLRLKLKFKTTSLENFILENDELKKIHSYLLGIEHLTELTQIICPDKKQKWDLLIYMGILYHHPSPYQQMQWLFENLNPGGVCFFETITLPPSRSSARVNLFITDRYAGMKKVYFFPTMESVEQWATDIGFSKVQRLEVAQTLPHEQRLTEWCGIGQVHSLSERLKFNQDGKAISTEEGHPPPYRTLWKFSI